MTDRGYGRIDVTVRLDKAHTQRFEAIVQELERRGLAQVEKHQRFMVVNGSVPAAGVDALRSVEGVAEVREDRVYKTQGGD